MTKKRKAIIRNFNAVFIRWHADRARSQCANCVYRVAQKV